MKIISHRGNLEGTNPIWENHPNYIEKALNLFDVEIDVWNINNCWFLGHDKPQYQIKIDFLFNNKLWCHAKNIEALSKMLEYNIHCFYHDKDDYTITSKGYIWAYPNKPLINSGISVVFGKNIPENFNGMGICTDYASLILD